VTASYCSQPNAWWCDSRRGWHFYDDPQPNPPRPRERKADHPPSPPSGPAELAQFELLKKKLEELRTIAIINPTEANVRRYMELEANVVAQASYFADVARRVAWATPELDMTLQGRPVNSKAIEVFDREQLEARSRSVAALATDHVLIFFFRSDCPYCHALAPTLEAFESRHGMQVVGVSIDGGGLPGLARYRRDNGISRTLGVTHVPAIFLARPSGGKIVPIGFGVLSEAQLLERITAVTAPDAEAMPPSLANQAVLP
jgi:conjugal transfer pilus assembly protein TraF